MPLPAAFSPKEAASLLHHDEATVRRWCREREIPALQIRKGGHWRIKTEPLRERNPDLYAELESAWFARQARTSRAADMRGW